MHPYPLFNKVNLFTTLILTLFEYSLQLFVAINDFQVSELIPGSSKTCICTTIAFLYAMLIHNQPYTTFSTPSVIQYVVLGTICSLSVSVMMLPYHLLFFYQTITGQTTKLLTFLILLELPLQYTLYLTGIETGIEFGLVSNTYQQAAYILKALLLLLTLKDEHKKYDSQLTLYLCLAVILLQPSYMSVFWLCCLVFQQYRVCLVCFATLVLFVSQIVKQDAQWGFECVLITGIGLLQYWVQIPHRSQVQIVLQTLTIAGSLAVLLAYPVNILTLVTSLLLMLSILTNDYRQTLAYFAFGVFTAQLISDMFDPSSTLMLLGLQSVHFQYYLIYVLNDISTIQQEYTLWSDLIQIDYDDIKYLLISIVYKVQIYSASYCLVFLITLQALTMPLSVGTMLALTFMPFLVYQTLSKTLSQFYQGLNTQLMWLLVCTSLLSMLFLQVISVMVEFKFIKAKDIICQYAGYKKDLYQYNTAFFMLTAWSASTCLSLKNCGLFKQQNFTVKYTAAHWAIQTTKYIAPLTFISTFILLELYRPSMMSLVQFVWILVVLWLQQEEYWKSSYILVAVFTTVQVLGIYMFQLWFYTNQDTDLVQDIFEGFNHDTMVQISVVIALSYVQQAVTKISHVQQQTLTLLKESLTMLVFSQGVNLIILILICLSFYMRNLFSFVYVVIAVRLELMQMHPQLVLGVNQSYKQVCKWINILVWYTTALLVYEYCVKHLNYILMFNKYYQYEFEFTGSLVELYQWTIETICIYPSKTQLNLQCVYDWNYWLGFSLNAFPNQIFVLQITLLILSYFVINTLNAQLDKTPLPKLDTEQDFTLNFDYVNTLLFQYLPYLYNAQLLACVFHFQNSEYSSLIQLCYLIVSLHTAIKFKTMFTNPNLTIIRVLNLLTFIVFYAFQNPLVLCPASTEYTAHDLCNSKGDSVYSTTMETIGLYKMHQLPTSLIWLFFITQLQLWCFSHPFYQLIIQRASKVDQSSVKIAADEIERAHLGRIWKAQWVILQKDILRNKLCLLKQECDGQQEIGLLLDHDYQKLQGQGYKQPVCMVGECDDLSLEEVQQFKQQEAKTDLYNMKGLGLEWRLNEPQDPPIKHLPKLSWYKQYFATRMTTSSDWFSLLQSYLFARTETMCLLAMFMIYIGNSNYISLVFVSFALIAILTKPSQQSWTIITNYLVCEICLKMIMQLPFFCASPPFGISQCDNTEKQYEELVTRIDFIIGLDKYYGPSSWPRNQGIFKGLLWDIVLLVLIVNLRRQKQYVWKYTQPGTIQTDPHFGQQKSQSFYENCVTFWQQLLPEYVDTCLPNLDQRTQYEMSVRFNAQEYKPGKDYFTACFYTTFMILLDTLFFWKSIIGVSQEIDINHFTTIQAILLFLLMCLLFVERMLYRIRGQSWVAKHRLAIRLGIYIAEVFAVHIAVQLWIYHQIKVSDYWPVKLYYMLWLAHFYYSGRQLKYGYPTQPYQQTFLRNTSNLYKYMWWVYRSIPFVWEMKVITDWFVTKTCLDLFEWFRYDDASQYLFYNKYNADAKKKRGEYEPVGWFEKFTEGFCFAFGIIVLIMIPVLLFSGLNPSMISNPVFNSDMSIQLQVHNVTYDIFAQSTTARNLTQKQVNEWNYTVVDAENGLLQDLSFNTYSESNWMISEPSINQLILDFYEVSEVFVIANFVFYRTAPAEATQPQHQTIISISFTDFQPIIDLLIGGTNEASFIAANIFPTMLRLDNTNTASILATDEPYNNYVSAEVTLTQSKSGLYWQYGPPLVLQLYSDDTSSMFGDAMTIGFIGLYVGIIYALGMTLRSIFDRYSEMVVYQDLPDTERLRNIIEGIDIAQSESDFEGEKQLHDLLVLIYRTPQMLLKMTGNKHHYKDDPINI